MKKETVYLSNHTAYQIEAVLPNAVRVRFQVGGVFRQTLTERYELVELPENDMCVTLTESKGQHTVDAGNLQVCIADDGTFSVRNKNCDEPLIERVVPFNPYDEDGVGGTIDIVDNERFYGGGFRPNPNIELRGQIIKNWAAPVTNNGPSTWAMSSRGWGLFWNHTGETFFDVGCRTEDKFVFWSGDGEFDVFFFCGSFKEMIADYTTITGKPSLMPQFAYGITIANNEAETEVSLMDKAERLRREGIPADTFSISCDWMSEYYDKSVEQNWNQSKYFIQPWMRAENTFISVLKNFGIKATLWTPCGYDLTYEQERRYWQKHLEEKREPKYTVSVRKGNNDGMSIDANSQLFRDENLYPTVRFDPYTKPDEAWAEHFKKFFDLGFVGLAEDAHMVELTKIDLCYGNGYTYKQMHNLNQSLNSQQYFESYKAYTGKRIFVRTPSTFIGHQRYCGTWCGDTTSDTSLVGLVQYSFQGQSNVSADLVCSSKEHIHAGMLMPWVLTFCWAHMSWPWMLSDEMRQIYIDYAKLRYALMPYIYTVAYQSHKSGLPMCRAMIIEYPDDESFFDNYHQYMLGDSFLVGALTDRIHLPKGQWIDFWTGREYEGDCDVTDTYPADKGGYLFLKKGAIVPLWENVHYVGEKPIEQLTVRMFPNNANTYTLYEDDGETFAFEDGGFATTDIYYRTEGDTLVVGVENTKGEYAGRPQHRCYSLEVYMGKPRFLPDGAVYDDEKGAVCVSVTDKGEVVIGL